MAKRRAVSHATAAVALQGQLFTRAFLQQGIQETQTWKSVSDSDLDGFIQRIKGIYTSVHAESNLNESTTEDEIIVKVLSELGWTDILSQQKSSEKRREDVPDFLLFQDADSKRAALKEKREDRRYRYGKLILESKRWLRTLDRGDATDRLDPGTPSNQMLRYLSSVEVASDRKVRWGILTNGAQWRLYYQGARSRSEEFLELNLAALVGVSGIQSDTLEDHNPPQGLKLFLCLFRRDAFLPQAWDTEGRTFHEYGLAEARHYGERVSGDLGERVFSAVFPDLANALASMDTSARRPYSREYLDEVREATLILLYRLLFVLYAEDRLLLPVHDSRYLEYSLRRIRQDVRDRTDAKSAFSATATRIWDALSGLFKAIAEGDKALGLPAYNGGLFEGNHALLLSRVRVPDVAMAPIIDELSRRVEDVARLWINYRDLSVQHLGSIYERLLEYRLEEADGRLVARPTSFARKTTGSFYTHEDLVKLIIIEAVGPLVREKKDAFFSQVRDWSKRRELKSADWQKLDALDPASGILTLRVCDPAMGSGHFLVSLVDYLADEILEVMDQAEHAVGEPAWGRKARNPWRSSLIARITDIRERILRAAKKHGWNVDVTQLDDRHIVRRMILKRVIHGVDRNPMAVELAKVALWLHTFTVGAPLSFLDHHLRCGDSLHGEHPDRVIAGLAELGVSFLAGEMTIVAGAKRAIETIAELTDIDIAEAHRSKELLDSITANLRPLQASLDLWSALRWLVPGWPAKRALAKSDWAEALSELLSGRIDWRTWTSATFKTTNLVRMLDEARSVIARERFLHWPLAFPHVWPDVGSKGFDAVIGNPPWDRIKLQEVEWFAERRPEIATAARAADRKRLIDGLKKKGDPLYQDYVQASQAAEDAARVVRESSEYPLLSGGDVNLYSLFVERSQALIHSRGMVGLLTPSGIAADKGAAEFFSSISSTGRISGLFDFENRFNPGGSYFPDVDSRFKFCSLIFGGTIKTFNQSRCAFYLHDVTELDDPNRILALSQVDFEAVNPNTGGAPIFRSRRDADITLEIYRRQPVFVDHRPERDGKSPEKVWPVRYATMFHMTNDSKLFKRRDELESDGWYPVEHNHFKKGDAIAMPLYVGRMVNIYDHRAAHVTVDSDNLHNPANSLLLTLSEKQRPDCYPTPQYWVDQRQIPEHEKFAWCLGYRDIARGTDVRTMIAAVIPTSGVGNTLPLLPNDSNSNASYADFAPLLLANLNSIAFDYVARQKAQSTHLNWYIVEQLPLITPSQFAGKVGKTKIEDFIRGEVLRLSYTASDLQPFASDLGYEGDPFKWDEEDRRHRMARLDALFFHLYDISRDDAAYILDTFPIVREQDEKEFGRYLTKDLVLAYINAISADDLTSVVSVSQSVAASNLQ